MPPRKASAEPSQAPRRSARVARDFQPRLPSPGPAQRSSQVQEPAGSVPPLAEREDSPLTSIPASGDERSETHEGREQVGRMEGVQGGLPTGTEVEDEGELGPNHDEQSAHVLITVHFVDHAGQVISTQPEDYALSTKSYLLPGQEKRVINIHRDIGPLVELNSPLRGRRGRIRTAGEAPGRYRPLGSVDKLLAGTAVLAFPSLAYLPISAPDLHGVHHAELFWEDIPRGPDGVITAAHSGPSAASLAPSLHSPPRRITSPNVQAEEFRRNPSSKVKSEESVWPEPRPTRISQPKVKIEEAAVVDLTADSDSDSPATATARARPGTQIDIVTYFRREWEPTQSRGQAQDMSDVLQRFLPITEKFEELLCTMQRTKLGFEIPSSSEFPSALHGLTLTKDHLRLIWGMTPTNFSESFGWFITHVKKLPEVKAWRDDPESAPYADVFNTMKLVEFRRLFKANIKEWNGDPAWINTAAQTAARLANAGGNQSRRPSHSRRAEMAISSSDDDTDGSDMRMSSPPRAPRANASRPPKRRRTPSEDNDRFDSNARHHERFWRKPMHEGGSKPSRSKSYR